MIGNNFDGKECTDCLVFSDSKLNSNEFWNWYVSERLVCVFFLYSVSFCHFLSQFSLILLLLWIFKFIALSLLRLVIKWKINKTQATTTTTKKDRNNCSNNWNTYLISSNHQIYLQIETPENDIYKTFTQWINGYLQYLFKFCFFFSPALI